MEQEIIKTNYFTAIDFETATANRNSACAVGIVSVENGKIVDEYYTLIKPPENEYNWHCISVHGITPEQTETAANFAEVYPEIKKRLQGKTIVAHNEAFDRSVLQKTIEYYGLDYSELELPQRWECTMLICRGIDKYPSGGLADCCRVENIELNHHEALSDARACAILYLNNL